MSIRIEQVTKIYQGTPVVNDVSIEIPTGEFFVLLGPSGSGKSTLLRALAGLTPIDHGRISLHGRDVTHLPARERGVGFVFQHYALFRHMTVADNIEFALRVRRAARAERAAAAPGAAAAGGAGGLRRPLAGAALGRPAAARRRGARARARAGGAAARRALRRARRQDSRGAARHGARGAAPPRHDDDPRHARPGRSLLARRPHRRHADGAAARDRRARAAVPPPATRFVATFLGAANLFLGEVSGRGLQLGSATIAPGHAGAAGPAGSEAVLVVRPEDIELATAASMPQSRHFAGGSVRALAFAGHQQHASVRLDHRCGIEPAVADENHPDAEITIQVLRSATEQAQLPVQVGMAVELGVRRVHALPTPISSFHIVSGDLPAARALQESRCCCS